MKEKLERRRKVLEAKYKHEIQLEIRVAEKNIKEEIELRRLSEI